MLQRINTHASKTMGRSAGGSARTSSQSARTLATTVSNLAPARTVSNARSCAASKEIVTRPSTGNSCARMRALSRVAFVTMSSLTPYSATFSSMRGKPFDIRGSPVTLGCIRCANGSVASAHALKRSISRCGPVMTVPS